MKVHCYVRPLPGEGSPFKGGSASDDVAVSPTAKALIAYAASLGHDRPQWWIESSLARPSRLGERDLGSQMLRALQDGDTLVIHAVGDLCDYPSDLDSVVKQLAGRGVNLQIATLTNASHSQVLRGAIHAFQPLEAQVEKLAAELAKVQGNADERLAHAVQVALTQLVENYGLPPAMKLGVPETVGPVDKPLGNGGVGAIIKAKREAKGLSQKALAEVLGVKQSTVSKMENGEPSTQWQAALAYLTSEGGEHAGA